MHDHPQHPVEPRPRESAGREALIEALDTSFRLLRWSVAILALLYLLSGVFIVRQHERAVVLMLGRITGQGEARIRGPGLHWTLPPPLAEVVRIETERARQIVAGELPATAPDELMAMDAPDADWENLLLTGDANLIGAQWSLRYTISDPEAYVFRHADPGRRLEAELHHAILHAAGRMPAEAALWTDVERFRAMVNDRVQMRIHALDLGVRAERVELIGIRPPAPVATAFESVVQAEQTRSRLISEARAQATRHTQEAMGEAARIRAEAEAERERWVSSARADADYFRAILEQEPMDPDRMLRRILLQETLQRAFSRVGQTWYLRPGPEGRQEVRMLLSPEHRGLMLPGEATRDAD